MCTFVEMYLFLLRLSGGLKKRIRDRMRRVSKKVMAIALGGRLKGPEGEERRVERYRERVSLTRKIVHQAEGVLEEMQHLPRHRQARLKRFRETLETMTGRVCDRWCGKPGRGCFEETLSIRIRS